MSNHSGSYMLNDVLFTLKEYAVFEFLGEEKTLQLIKEILEISYKQDCNTGEILESIGHELGICYYCLRYADDVDEGGLCKDCR